MAGLLARAKELLGQPAPRTMSRYSLRCYCGGKVEGTRDEHWQVVNCPRCGNAHFILNESPLPEVKLKARGAAKPKPVDLPKTDPAAFEDDPLAPAAQADGTAAPPELEGVTSGTVRADIPEELLAPPDGLAGVPERIDRYLKRSRALGWLRPWLRPQRLAFVAVTVVVVAALLFQWRRAVLREYADTLVPRGAAGLEALAVGDLDAAEKDLAYAVAGLDALQGQSFPDQHLYRQALAELRLCDDLIYGSLDDALAGPPELAGRAVAGRTVILDAEVGRAADGGWAVGVVAVADGKPVTVHPAGLQLFETLGIDEPRRLIFGARMAGVTDEDGIRRLRLEPDSGVLMTSETLYREHGFATGDAVAQVRREQQELVAQGRL